MFNWKADFPTSYQQPVAWFHLFIYYIPKNAKNDGPWTHVSHHLLTIDPNLLGRPTPLLPGDGGSR